MAVSFISAQEVTPSIGAHSKALLFTFNGLSVLRAADYNGGIGAKYYLTNAMALRGGIGFGYMTQSIPVPGGATGTDGTISGIMYGLNAGMEFHLLPGRVSPFVGGAFSLSSNSTENSLPIVPPGLENTDKNGGRAGAGGLTLGAGGILGVEFFLTKEISLSTEYMLGYTLTSTSDYEQIRGAVTTKFKTGNISAVDISNSGALTLAVHF